MHQLEKIGLTKVEFFQTMAAMAPNIMHQEKKTPEEAAAKARRLIFACVAETEAAFAPQTERSDASLHDPRNGPDLTPRPAPPSLDRVDPDQAAREMGMRLATRQVHQDRR